MKNLYYKKRIGSLEILCLIRLTNLIEKADSIEAQTNFTNHLNGNLSIKLFSRLMRRGLLNDQLIDTLLKSINRLENINLNELNLIESTNKLTNDGLDILLKKFNSNLKILILNTSKIFTKINFTDTQSLFKISINCPNLLHLELQGCFLIRDAGVAEICKECKFLEKLNFSGCTGLNNLALESTSVLKNLKSINFSQTNINDNGIEEFLNKKINIGNLQEAIFNSCKCLTKSSIESMFQKCVNLKRLSFNDCPKVQLDFDINFNRSCFKEIVWTLH
jgi:hypothetical protein